MPAGARFKHTEQLHERVRTGSPRIRGLYVGARRQLARSTYRPRRRLAREISDGLASPIEPDVGFRLFAPGELPGAGEVVEASRAAISSAEVDAQGLVWSRPKRHIARSLVDPATETLDSPLMRFALSEGVLGRVTDYLGIVPLLSYVDIWLSRHVDKAPRSSQLYHCDNEDISQMKIFVHGSNVTRASGPLTVIDAARSESVMRKLDYTFGAGRVDDERIRSLVEPEDEHPLEGPPGTACFLDTSRCLHYGSRVEEGAPRRLVAVFQYVSPSAFFLPPDFRQGAPFRHLAGDDATDVQRLVLGAA